MIFISDFKKEKKTKRQFIIASLFILLIEFNLLQYINFKLTLSFWILSLCIPVFLIMMNLFYFRLYKKAKEYHKIIENKTTTTNK
ncbi:MAG: hypothetical protein J7J86_04900 [Bacteroidales bacterium]|nr:hypothetical protein [Bacteroidales bacterium]